MTCLTVATVIFKAMVQILILYNQYKSVDMMTRMRSNSCWCKAAVKQEKAFEGRLHIISAYIRCIPILKFNEQLLMQSDTEVINPILTISSAL